MHLYALLRVFLVCLLAWTVVSEDSCEFNQTCSASFVDSDIHLVGCPTVVSNDFPRSVASLNCLDNIQCKAIICNSTMCSQCTGDQINALTFNLSSATYIKRKVVRLNMEYHPVTLNIKEVIPLPDGLSPGDLVKVRATPLKFDDFIFEFLVDAINTNFHFRTRCASTCADYSNCTAALCASGKHMILSSKVNNQWSASGITDSNYPFTLNQQFELHFLVLSSAVRCYIDRKYYRTYTTPFPAESVQGIRVRGTVNVHELSA